MSFTRNVWLPLLWATLIGSGCGGAGLGISDGGPVGTGITASVVGNVVAVEDPTMALATGGIESIAAATSDESIGEIAKIDDIEVSLVEFPDLSTRTDDEGNFTLDGEFAGAVTLRFRTPDFDVEQALEVPSGSVVVLSDIELDRDGLTAEAGRQLGLHGRVREIDCAAGRLTVEDRRGDRFDVTLLDETEILRDGAALACDDIARDDEVSVEGLLDDLRERSVRALLVTIGADSSEPRPPERLVAFLGNVAALDCGAAAMILHDGQQIIRLLIGDDTVIRTPGDRALSCSDLALGDRINGTGLLDLRRPGRVRAQRLIVGGRLGPGVPLGIRGFIVETQCDRDVLILAFHGAVFGVRILPDTRIEAPGDFSCDRLRPGISVRGRGVVSTELPGGLDAIELSFRLVRDQP